MVKKLSPYEKAKKAFAQVNSVLQHRIKERDNEIASLKLQLSDKDIAIKALEEQGAQFRDLLTRPPLVADQAMRSLKILEHRVAEMSGKLVSYERQIFSLRGQLIQGARALSQFMKPTV